MRHEALFARVLLRVGPLEITDTLLTSLALTLALATAGGLLVRSKRARTPLTIVYGALERTISNMVQIDARPLLPLILTQWLFIVSALATARTCSCSATCLAGFPHRTRTSRCRSTPMCSTLFACG